MRRDDSILPFDEEPLPARSTAPGAHARRAGTTLLLIVLCLAAVVSIAPDAAARFWPQAVLSDLPIVAQLIAMRSALVAVLGALGLLLLVVGGFRSLGRAGGRRSSTAGLVLVLIAAVHAGILWQRGLDRSAAVSAPGSGSSAVTVLSLNTYKQSAGIGAAASIAEKAGADVIVLPEADASYATRLAVVLARAGGSYRVFSSLGSDDAGRLVDASSAAEQESASKALGSDTLSTSVLVSTRLGSYTREARPTGLGVGNVLLEPTGTASMAKRPVILGVHTVSPALGTMPGWRSSVLAAAAECKDGVRPSGLVAAGDFNASLDHAGLRELYGCSDAATATGIGGLSTWPTASRTALLGSTIDHVLADASAWKAEQGQVVTVPGTDHRGLLVRLAPVG